MRGGQPRSAMIQAVIQVLQFHACEQAHGPVLFRRLRRFELDPVKLRQEGGTVPPLTNS